MIEIHGRIDEHAPTAPLRFGIFLPPMHPTGQNPTLLLQRDLELIEHLDALGYDEAWIGEHHSSGFETIASPEVFIAAAAERTSNIKLGTGVNSLPYHHPLILADRIMMLDHLTKGRMMFGVGPGQLTSDASMLGIEPNDQRRMMEESFEVIMALFRGEIVSAKTDWFTVHEGRLQFRSYTQPLFDVAVAASISPSGPKLAGRYGTGLLSIAATSPEGFAMLAGHWAIMEEQAAEHGTTVDRAKWRMMGPMHIAETEQEALDNCRYGLERVMDYLAHVVPTAPRDGDHVRGARRRDERVRRRRHRHAGHGDRPDPAPDRPVRRLRVLPHVRRRPRRLRGRRSAPTSCSRSTSCRTSRASWCRRRRRTTGSSAPTTRS